MGVLKGITYEWRNQIWKKKQTRPPVYQTYRVVQKVGYVAYELQLTSKLKEVHSLFHLSMLRKCLRDLSRVTPIEDIQDTKELSYKEIPVAILDRQICKLRTKEVASVKVHSRYKNKDEMMWEAKEYMKPRFPHLFSTMEGNNANVTIGHDSTFEGKALGEGGDVTPHI